MVRGPGDFTTLNATGGSKFGDNPAELTCWLEPHRQFSLLKIMSYLSRMLAEYNYQKEIHKTQSLGYWVWRFELQYGGGGFSAQTIDSRRFRLGLAAAEFFLPNHGLRDWGNTGGFGSGPQPASGNLYPRTPAGPISRTLLAHEPIPGIGSPFSAV